jgi:hypothetical protein
MNERSIACGIAVLCSLVMSSVSAAQKAAPAANSLTIYNQDFALVRTPVDLDLKAGTTQVSATNVTAQVEPDSVVLRDPAGKQPIRILEQNYDGALRVQAQMLAKFEGKTIDFLVPQANGEPKIVPGKIVRSGSVPQYDLIDRYGQNYFFQMNQPQMQTEPLIAVDGKLRYGLPGTPLFPAQADGLTLKPTLHWLIESERPLKIPAELDYMTKGLRWDATYNVIASADTDTKNSPSMQRLELIGWVNVTNESGTDFHGVSLQLMAGDLSKLIGPNGMPAAGMGQAVADSVVVAGMMGGQEQISHKSFDEYQLYDLHRTTDLLDHQNKQIEFLNVADIPAERVYVYDGFKIDNNPQFGMRYLQPMQENFGGGVSTNKKVWAMQEFKNSEANHLGMPLPKGRMRFYRRDATGNLEFIGENQIDHTPKNETVSVFLGDAFDLTGDRVRTDFKTNQRGTERTIVETYKITLKNVKTNAVKVRVVEHMYRTANWSISNNVDDYVKKDSQTAEFNVDVPADGEKQITYTVTYTW